MDGFEKDSSVIVIAATNRIEMLDDALLRAGRFDRHIHLDLPSVKERESILKIYLDAAVISVERFLHWAVNAQPHNTELKESNQLSSRKRNSYNITLSKEVLNKASLLKRGKPVSHYIEKLLLDVQESDLLEVEYQRKSENLSRTNITLNVESKRKAQSDMKRYYKYKKLPKLTFSAWIETLIFDDHLKKLHSEKMKLTSTEISEDLDHVHKLIQQLENLAEREDMDGACAAELMLLIQNFKDVAGLSE